MALLGYGGFDHFGTGADPVVFGKWASSVSALTSSAITPRTGPYALRFGSTSGEIITKAVVTSGGAVVGMAMQCPAFTANDIIQIREGTTVHVALAISAGGILSVKRGSTTLATGTTVLVVNNWYYIELATVIHDTTGTYEVKIDGVSEAALTATGQDTRNAGTGVWDRVRLSSAGAVSYVDDVYICDTSGSAPQNTFLGSVKVDTLFPQADSVAAGTNAGLTPSTGTDHGALVNETTPNVTNYNGSATVGVKDTYNYPAMVLTGTIFGVQLNLYIQKADAAVRTVCPVVRSGGTDYDGANISPTTTFAYWPVVYAQNPATSAAWTTADVAAMEAGMKVTA